VARLLGSHQSIAGGHHKAVERASARGFDCVQLFTGNPRSLGTPRVEQPRGKRSKRNPLHAASISDEQAAMFRRALDEYSISHPLAHDSYLINLASPDSELWEKSILAFVEELHRAEILGIPYVVTHPGCSTEGTPRAGIRKIIRALNRILRTTRGMAAQCLLETTAGQGTSLGWRFEHLAAILDGVREPERLGVCLDTCHVFAAGYALDPPQQYEETLGSFDELVGLSCIKTIHLNDSARPLGSRVDRHSHIGRGQIGLEAFRRLLSDRRLETVPVYLETPKGEEDGVDFDIINLNTLRQLLPDSAG